MIHTLKYLLKLENFPTDLIFFAGFIHTSWLMRNKEITDYISQHAALPQASADPSASVFLCCGRIEGPSATTHPLY